MAYQIFISYRRDGGEALAYLIHEHLSAAGYSVFYDIESLNSGKFNTKILEVMDSCTDVLAIFPPKALDRCVEEDDWLRRELTYAIKNGKNIIPIMMRGFTWPETLPEDLYDLRHYNGVTVTFDFFDGVMLKIAKYLTKSPNSTQEIRKNNNLKHMLFWGDFESAYMEKIFRKLDFGENYYLELLDDPVEVLSKDLNEIYAIVLIVTDCTKFSSNRFAVQRMNECFEEYVRKGGKLICAHDVIYRRTKNDILQKMYGCKITNFRQEHNVGYKKTEECLQMGLFSSLPNEFVLHDDEVCWGDIADDIDVYFETEDGIPLVYSREYGRGICMYLNSGDFKERLPRSILKPEKEFVELLKELIQLQ